MTDEVREKLLALNPMTATATHKFVPAVYTENDIPEEYTPLIEVRQLNNEEAEEVTLLGIEELLDATKSAKITAKSILKKSNIKKKKYREIVKGCIVSWDNYIEPTTGQRVNLEDFDFDSMPDRTLLSIYSEILKISGLSQG